MDVVYIVRPGDRNEELRYSLRSLANLAHDRVFVAGYRPLWVDAEHIAAPQRQGDKQGNAQRNLRAACSDDRVSDPFVVFNDDMFVMRRMRKVPTLHRGLLVDVIAEHTRRSQYARSMIATGHLLDELGYDAPLCYEMHAPMVIDKAGMLWALGFGRAVYGVHNRTLYGNMNGIGGRKSADCKVYSERDTEYPSWPFISTNDSTFRRTSAGAYIRESFPNPSPYEKR